MVSNKLVDGYLMVKGQIISVWALKSFYTSYFILYSSLNSGPEQADFIFEFSSTLAIWYFT